MPEGEYISAKDAALILRVSRQTIWRYVKSGTLKPAGYTPKGQARFSRAAVEALRDESDRKWSGVREGQDQPE